MGQDPHVIAAGEEEAGIISQLSSHLMKRDKCLHCKNCKTKCGGGKGTADEVGNPNCETLMSRLKELTSAIEGKLEALRRKGSVETSIDCSTAEELITKLQDQLD